MKIEQQRQQCLKWNFAEAQEEAEGTRKTPKILLKKKKRLLQVREQEPKGSGNKPDREDDWEQSAIQ